MTDEQTDTVWMCWWKSRNGSWWAMHWTAASLRRDSIAKHNEGGQWDYTKERRKGNVRCVKTTLTADMGDR